jgi:hypothetical protein
MSLANRKPGARATGPSRHGAEGHAGLISQRFIDFEQINRAALGSLPALLCRWLPDGQRLGREWVALNPTRADRRRGSFRINLETGRWADFASGDAGGDVVSLAAYLFGLRQAEAARRLAEMLGLDGGAHERR